MTKIVVTILSLLLMGCRTSQIIRLKATVLSTNGCTAFKDYIEHHVYYHKGDKMLILNTLEKYPRFFEDCSAQLTRTQIIQVFGEPLHSDESTMCYKIMKDEYQPTILGIGSEKVRSLYNTLIFDCHQDTIVGCSIRNCRHLQPIMRG